MDFQNINLNVLVLVFQAGKFVASQWIFDDFFSFFAILSTDNDCYSTVRAGIQRFPAKRDDRGTQK
jgi:hypothetical protein